MHSFVKFSLHFYPDSVYPPEFHEFPDVYLHRVRSVSDTGLKMEWPQEDLLIPLDIFRASLQNKGIKNELDAWLAFLSVEEPEIIEQLIRDYPQFTAMYQQIYEICGNTERVMELFSEELKILDRNTVQLMIDEMQDEINGQKKELTQMSQELLLKNQLLSQANQQLSQTNQQLSQTNQQLSQTNQQLSQKDAQIELLSRQSAQQLKEKEQEIEHLRKQLAKK